jgi:hypothetical protein
MLLMLTGIVYLAVITGAFAEQFVKAGQAERVEELDAATPGDLTARVEQLTQRSRELADELEALRLAVTGSPTSATIPTDG